MEDDFVIRDFAIPDFVPFDFAMTSNIRYAAPVSPLVIPQNERGRKKKALSTDLAITIVGAGRLGSALALALHEFGFTVGEIIARDSGVSLRRTKRFALKVGARGTTMRLASLDSGLLDSGIIWICVPDREIRNVALALVERLAVLEKTTRKNSSHIRFAFHSSGALDSTALTALREHGIAVASVHPLMTFVGGVMPSFKGVPIAIDGDRTARQMARRIVSKLGGKAIPLRTANKAAYHAWATMTSPLLVAYLVTLEEAASIAGLNKRDARRMSLPIIQQTLANYSSRGPAESFSGPIIRGDVDTVSGHLTALKRSPRVHAIYRELAQMAVNKLPANNKRKLRSLFNAQQEKVSDKTEPKV